MKSYKFLIDQSRNWKLIEKVHKKIIDLLIEFQKTFLFKVKSRGHLSALMITSDHINSILIVNLKSQNQYNNLN